MLKQSTNRLGRDACIFVVASTCVSCVFEPSQRFGESPIIESTEELLIYGSDDRVEYGSVAGTPFGRWSDSTAALVQSTSISCSGGNCALATSPWTTDSKTSPPNNRLCSSVRFRAQPALAFCSGFLVAPDLIVSARHCIDAVPCSQTSFVFGYNADASGGGIPANLASSLVYTCNSVVATGGTEDWILLKADRVIQSRAPLNVRYQNGATLNQTLAIIGHPNGIPVKISPAGAVTDTSATVSFSHNIDSFAGNSGSPVLDAATGIVEGIHVTPPASHFVASTDASGACVVERVCPVAGCPGTSGATRITRLSSEIPLTPVLTIAATGA